MNNLHLLAAATRIVGLYLLITTIAGAFPIIQVFWAQQESMPDGWVWLYLLPMAIRLVLALAMVLAPMKLASWGASGASTTTQQTQLPDIALIGVRLLGIYFILQAVPGLFAVPVGWPVAANTPYGFLSFLLHNLAPPLVFLAAGVWMFVGGQRLASFIKSARTANFEREKIN